MTNGLFSLFSSLIANTPPFYRKGLSSRKFLSLFLILFLAVGNAWAEDVTWEGPYGNFVTKKLSDNKTEITIEQSTGSSSKTISCIQSSKQSYLSINGSGKYLKFIAPTGYTITNIQMVWMSGAANQALPILFGEEISAIGTVETKDNAVTITNGGFKMTSVIATNGGNNCDLPDNIVLPTGTKEVMIGRSGAYNNTDYATIGNVAATVKFRLAGSSGYFNTGVGTGSTPFIGRVVLTVVPEVSCDAANLTASNITSNGNQEAGTGITFSKVGTPASGDTWYWQTSATGTDKTYSASSSYTTATTAGSYTVYLRAYNSASDCWGTAASMTNTIYPAPSAMIHNTFAVNAAWSSTIATQDKANITNLNAMAAVGQSVGTGSDKAGLTQKIPSQSSEEAGKYMSLSFNVAAGKQLNVTSVVFDEQPITNTGTFKVSISDNQSSATKTQTIASGSAGAPHTLTLDGDIVGSFKGTVTVKVWAYGWSEGYRFGNYFYVNGTVEEVEPPVTTTYTVTYNANGGSGEMAKTTNEIVASTFTAPNGKMFKEWNTASDGNGTSYAAGDAVTDNLNLYAIWKDIQNFDVKFYSGYGENTQIGETQSVILDGKAEKPADPTREGYRFVGWSTDGTEANIKTIEDYAIIEATTFTAVWKQVHTVSFDLQGHGDAIDPQDIISGEKATKPADPVVIGWDFGGWFTDAACTAGNEFNFNTAIDADKELYAKWTEFEGCVVLAPATTSGTTPASKANVELQTGSYGGKIIFAGAKDNNWAASFAYTENGLALQKGGADSIRVQLDYQMKVGTKLTFVVYTANDDKDRGFYLKNSSNETESTFAAKLIGETIYTYTVVEGDGLAGNSVFILGRNQTAYLKSIKVTNCGGKIVSINTAISPAEAVDKANVTLSANKSVEGQTITATYSSIESGWDFDKWEVNGGATMDDAQANPVTITMGAENPTVTLVLKPGAIKHTVSFDAQGGSAVESQLVEENGNPILPAEPTKEDYIFKGWAEAADGAAVDVTSFIITEPKIFYAIWESDGAIKLLDKTTGAINTTNFTTGVTKGKVTISGVEYNSATFGGTQGAISGVGDLKKFVQYNAKTNKTKIQISLYNSNNSAKEIYLQMITEGETTAVVETLQVDANSRYTSEYYEYNNEKNRSVYITTNSTDVKILQVKVIESGEKTLKNAGEVGYSLNFNKGRVFGKGGSNISFEGLNATFSSDYKPINSTEARIKSTNISFNIASPVLLKVTTSNDKKYYVSQESNGTDNATEKTGTSEFELKTIGTWYVKADASEVKITKIEFLAPKCDAPVFNALANSDICSGDLYVALDGTGTVTDEGTITYKWYAEGGTDVLVETATYTPTADGSYYVVATNSLAGYTDNVVQSEVVTVTTHSSAAITTAPENVRMDAGETATLAVVATGKNVTYQWYTCDADGNNATEIVGATTASYEFTVGTGVQYYKVVVSSDCGTPVEAVVKVEEWTELPLADVAGAITWDFSKAVTAETTLPSGDAEIVLANVAGVALNGEFESNKLKVAGTRLRTTYIQAKKLMFHATIPGKVTIEFSNTGNKDYDRILYVNGVETTAKSKNQDHVTYSIVVPAGDVVIQAWEKAAQPEDETWNLLNIYSLSFSMADYIRTGLTVGSLGTICLPSNVPAGYAFGATFYELKGKEPQYGKIVFDEILSDELEEGKPYLFQAQGETLYCFYGTESVSDPDNSGAMKGTFVDLELTELSNIYYFAQKALWSCVDLSSLSVPANRAYVKMDEMPAISESNPAPGVRRITLGVNGQNTATGVDQVQGDEVPTKMIINGQLFILRGEKMYDAQGKLVK